MSIEEDRADYWDMLASLGVEHAKLRAHTENSADQIPMPRSFDVDVRPSPIDGLGIYTTRAFQAGEILAPARIGVWRTPVGRYTNHAKRPNCLYVPWPPQVVLVARHVLQAGDEATVDYRLSRLVASTLEQMLSVKDGV